MSRINGAGLGTEIAFPQFVTDQLDRKAAAFYLTLMALVILDLILMVWMFNPLSQIGTRVYASEKPGAISDLSKPSPFEVYARKTGR